MLLRPSSFLGEFLWLEMYFSEVSWYCGLTDWERFILGTRFFLVLVMGSCFLGYPPHI